jgi:hypothetical protein
MGEHGETPAVGSKPTAQADENPINRIDALARFNGLTFLSLMTDHIQISRSNIHGDGESGNRVTVPLGKAAKVSLRGTIFVTKQSPPRNLEIASQP